MYHIPSIQKRQFRVLIQAEDVTSDSIHYTDGLVQERRNSIANTLELRLSCTYSPISANTIYKIFQLQFEFSDGYEMTQDRGLEYADISTWMIYKEVWRSKQLSVPSSIWGYECSKWWHWWQ